MEREVFEQFREIIHRESGIWLSDQKIPLLSSRIMKRLRALGISNESEYLKIVQLDVAGDELASLLDVISTNTTHFYREGKHFEFLSQEIFRQYSQQNKNRIRIWSAACSSGEEPYTIAMLARECLDLRRVDFKMLATDICSNVLRAAHEAVYGDRQLRELPKGLREKYMERLDGDTWRVRPELQSLVVFKKLNLIKFPWPMKGPFDVIFCRNVMIYFDRPVRQQLADAFYRYLADGGYFFVSHSESLSGIEHGFERVANSVYQKRGGERR